MVLFFDYGTKLAMCHELAFDNYQKENKGRG
jgi:hypothetical protein